MWKIIQEVWKWASHFDTASGLFSWTGLPAVLGGLIPAGAAAYYANEAGRNLDLVIFFSLGSFAFFLIIVQIWQRLPLNRSEKIWFERSKLELYVLAYLSVWKRPKMPIDKEPELTRLRYLADAYTDGELIIHDLKVGHIDIISTISLPEFKKFANAKQHNDFIKLAKRWEKANPDGADEVEARTTNVSKWDQKSSSSSCGEESLLRESKPKYDVWLYDVIFQLIEHRNGKPYIDLPVAKQFNEMSIACKKVRQAASDGDLTIWGREGYNDNSIIKEIAKDYWEYYQINPISNAFISREESELETEPTEHANKKIIYRHLQTNKEQVENYVQG